MDFFGVNFYGAEWLAGQRIAFKADEEYSEAGRAIDVNGLYSMLVAVHRRFAGLPIIITENGIADAEDDVRSSYIIEHLRAVNKAMKAGIQVDGFFVWTLTDNLEWSDGYCPKFGLVGVDRSTFERVPRGSYYLMKEIFTRHVIADSQAAGAWQKVVSLQGKPHQFCRANDGATALDRPTMRAYSMKGWRFKDSIR